MEQIIAIALAVAAFGGFAGWVVQQQARIAPEERRQIDDDLREW